jgi:TRAP transporter TAXI family solute receptor
MKRTRVIGTGIVCLLIIGLVWSTAYAEWKPKQKYLTIYNGSLGGGWHPVATLTADIVKGAIPQLSTKPGPGGGVANAKKLEGGQGRIGMCLSNTQVQAYKGMAPFKKPHKNLRHIISMYQLPFIWIVRKDSGITSLKDLGDKRISPAKVGQTTYALAQASLKAYGITFDSIKANGGIVQILGDKERVNMLKDKHVDAIACMWPLNHANFLSLQVMPGIRLISMDKPHIKKIMASTPGIAELEIPKGTFQKDQKKDAYSISAVTTLIGRADVDEELVYRIVKAMVEAQERYHKYVPASDIAMNTPLVGNMIPVHPGAMRYFKEKGLVK